MAILPRFVFPARQPSDTQPETVFDSAAPKERPRISLQTRSREGRGYTLSVPETGYRRPQPLGSVSTPPDSPTRPRSYTMGGTGPPNLHESSAETPPPTPTKASHSKTSSSASSYRNSLDSLRRGNSISSLTGSGRKFSIDETERPGSTELRHFPYWLTDYDIEVDHDGKKKPLGTGAWSKVYLAKPCLPKSTEPVLGAEVTPPVTPSRSRTSSLSKVYFPQIPSAYAVKEPYGRTAHRVLGDESRILSYLSRFPGADKHIVPFYGQDSRTDALVLGLMDGTLEDWIQKELNCLTEEARAAKLTQIFPVLASHLLDGFAWMQEKGCAHGDLKPANILVSPTTSPVPHAVYTDFSSAYLPAAHTPSQPQTPFGGGTYEFLDPTLMTKASAATPASPTTDLWSLAMTLLVVVLGVSPFSRVATNEYMKKEFIKQGNPLATLSCGDNAVRNVRRMQDLSKSLGFDVQKWFAMVLIKDLSKRVGVVEWRCELGRIVS